VHSRQAQQPFEVSAFEGTSFHFTASLPWTAVYGPSGRRRDFGRVEGLLDYVCDVADAIRRSTTLPEMQRWGQELTALLLAAVEGGLENPSDEFLADVGARFQEGVLWDRRLERVRGGVGFRYGARIVSLDGFYALLAVLLMHPTYRQLLRRCLRCGKIFVRTGKRLFCGPECATAANDAGVLKRQKNQRLRRAAQELLRPHVASGAKRAAAVKEAFRAHPEVTTPEQLAGYARALLQGPRRHK